MMEKVALFSTLALGCALAPLYKSTQRWQRLSILGSWFFAAVASISLIFVRADQLDLPVGVGLMYVLICCLAVGLGLQALHRFVRQHAGWRQDQPRYDKAVQRGLFFMPFVLRFVPIAAPAVCLLTLVWGLLWEPWAFTEMARGEFALYPQQIYLLMLGVLCAILALVGAVFWCLPTVWRSRVLRAMRVQNVRELEDSTLHQWVVSLAFLLQALSFALVGVAFQNYLLMCIGALASGVLLAIVRTGYQRLFASSPTPPNPEISGPA